MKSNQIIFAIFALLFAVVFTTNANAQFGDLLNKAKNKIDKTQQKTEQTTNQTPQQINQPETNGGSSIIGGRMAKPGEAGFIGLSKKPIDPNNLSATPFTKSFANGEYIYGIVYFPKPLSEYLTVSNYNTNKKDMVIGGFYAGDEYGAPRSGDPKYYDTDTKLSVRIYATPDAMNQKYATFAVFPDPKSNFSFSEGISGYSNVAYFIENAYTKAKKYDFALRFKTTDGTFQTVAELIDVSIDFSNKAPYLALKNAYNKSMGQEMGKQVEDKPLEPAANTNAALQKQFSALAQSQLGDAKLLKLNVLSPSWQVVRNEITGVITHRYMASRGIVRESEGYCRTRYVLFTQNYNGAGYGTTLVNANGATDDWVIPCELAK